MMSQRCMVNETSLRGTDISVVKEYQRLSLRVSESVLCHRRALMKNRMNRMARIMIAHLLLQDVTSTVNWFTDNIIRSY